MIWKRISICWAVLLLGVTAAIPAAAGSLLVQPDGTGDVPTIQGGINAAAPGDTILLASGTFTGGGNRNINFIGKEVTVRSVSGDPLTCIIDCEGVGRGFSFMSAEGPGAVIEGLTITRGNSSPGGAIRIWSDASPTIRDCVFLNNTAEMIGGAICVVIRGAPRLENCIFEGNTASFGGAVICWVDAEPIITGCTFIENSAPFGGAIECADRAIATVESCVFIRNTATRGGAIMSEESGQVILKQCTFFANQAEQNGAGICCEVDGYAYAENTIIAFSTLGDAVYCTSSSSATLLCSDIYQNAGGDWVGCIEDQYGLNGNISLDPLFCNAGSDDLTVHVSSPCAPENNPECGLIGALPVGCDDVSGVDEEHAPVAQVRLHQNAPNPFNPVTTISYDLAVPSLVFLRIYDLAGRLVRGVVNGQAQEAGRHETVWDGRDDTGTRVSAGVYIYKFVAGSYSEMKRMVLVK